MLRKIVVRERQEEARREQAKKLMLAEFEKLQIKSDTLNQQIELLAQPVTKLTPEELALLRQPVVGISDSNPAAFTASFTAPKNSGSGPGPSVQTTAEAGGPGRTGADRARSEREFRSWEISRGGKTVPGDPDEKSQQSLFTLESGGGLFPHRQIEGGGVDVEESGGAGAEG